MQLPKNITQIGEANHRCKIYAEDYVISYMKQLNRVACDKDMAVALYGVRKEENEVSYLFLYGACKLTFLQRETRHLSQAQLQEIERARAKYFPEHVFLGYRLLNGEMIEGFHICEQGICRYISGYAQFYEKNDNMLAYMLDVREETQPEVVEQEKYEVVKKKQEERRSRYEEDEHPQNKYQKAISTRNSGSLRGMRVAVVAVFALLCMIGITSLNGNGEVEDLQAMARQVMDDVMAQRIPDAEDSVTEEVLPEETDSGAVAEVSSTNTLVAADELTEALLQENEVSTHSEDVAASVAMVEQSAQDSAASVPVPESAVVEPAAENMSESVVTEPATENVSENTTTESVAPSEEVVKEVQPTSYIIKEGDTLIGISVLKYGSDTRVKDICALNQIQDPDDIMVGQKILLP